MRLLIAIPLMLLGGGIILVGFGMAVWELVGMYQSAIADPLGAPADQAQTVSRSMLRGCIIGAVGIPFMMVGTYQFFKALKGKYMPLLSIGRWFHG